MPPLPSHKFPQILQVGSLDLIGQRFNGHSFHRYLLSQGMNSDHLVWDKSGQTPHTRRIVNLKGRRSLNNLVSWAEDTLSVQSLLYPWSFLLPFRKEFRKADLVHFHLLHWPKFFSLFSLPLLTRLRPSVWTIHDCWPLTGHCIQPFHCDRWKTGCGHCPDLKVESPMRRDRTALMWNMKNWIYSLSRMQLIVASTYMMEKVRSSPLLNRFPVEQIPFGIDLSVFCPGDDSAAKRSLGIDPESLVIAFRHQGSAIKGSDYVFQALRGLTVGRKLTLLIFNEAEIPADIEKRFSVIKMDWIGDENESVNAIRAADIFVMPSRQEAFGMMAIEAMACGKPVITMTGTSLPEVVGGGEIGLVVPQGDERALLQALQALVDDDALRKLRSARALEFARKTYGLDLHVKRVQALYSKVLRR